MSYGFFRVLWRLDGYYIRMYLKTALLCAVGCVALITIGDLFQKADDFLDFASGGVLDMLKLMGTYYLNSSPLLLLRFLFPVVLLVPAVIVLTGAAQQNEYVVLRASGVSARRALMPLLMPALVLALAYGETRDYFVPAMAVASKRKDNELRGKRPGRPIQVALADGDWQDSAAIGLLDLDWIGSNFLLERRHRPLYRQYPETASAGDRSGDPDDVRQFLAKKVVLRFHVPGDEEAADDVHRYEWVPLEGGRLIDFGYYRREEREWREPLPTMMTPAMFERHTLGDLVLTRDDLARLEPGDAAVTVERHRRMAEPWMAFVVVVLGTSAAMRLALVGRHTSYVQNILTALLVAGGFYFLGALCGAMGESLDLDGRITVWLPLAVAAPAAMRLWWRLDA